MDTDILVVDDTKVERFFLCKLLERVGMGADEAGDGLIAETMAAQKDYRLVLLDEKMPGQDGWTTAEHIRRFRPDLPVVILGEQNQTTESAMFILKKPVEYRRLTEVMQKCLAPRPGKQADAPADGLDQAQGIRNCGSEEGYREALAIYYRTIDEKADEIEGYYQSGDIDSYTIKVHALKSSSRIIGANGLADLAEQLEAAGKAGDEGTIRARTEGLLEDYRHYREVIAPLLGEVADDGDKEPVPDAVLADAYASFPEFIDQMDVDLMEMVLNSLDEYRLPPDDAAVMNELRDKLLHLDWDGMSELLGNRS